MNGTFVELRLELAGLAGLGEGWDSYGAEAPGEEARVLAERILGTLEAAGLKPVRVLASAEGGIGLAFAGKEVQAGIEIYNSGEMVASIWGTAGEPRVWEVRDSCAFQ